jgi:hypothetical protein
VGGSAAQCIRRVAALFAAATPARATFLADATRAAYG